MIAKYWKIIVIVVASVLIIAVLVVVFTSWLASRDAAVKAQAQTDAQRVVQEQIDKQQKVLAEQITNVANLMRDMKAEQDAKLKDLESRFARTSTPTDLAALVSQLAKMQQPAIVVTPQPTAANPNPQPTIQISDLNGLKLYTQQCEECKVNLDTRTRELSFAATREANLNDQLKLNALTLDSKDKEIISWKQAAQGGTTWQRARKRIGYFIVDAAIVGGITVAATCGTGHCK